MRDASLARVLGLLPHHAVRAAGPPQRHGARGCFLDAHLRQQEGQFASAVDSLAEALSYVSADALRDRVSRAVGKAFQSA